MSKSPTAALNEVLLRAALRAERANHERLLDGDAKQLARRNDVYAREYPHELKRPRLKMQSDLTVERLRERLSYSPDTGHFHWRSSAKLGGGVKSGQPAGTKVTDGYISIGIDQKYYKAHRLAWLYVYGTWPSKLIDHIDGDTSNNRIDNLREADHAQNYANSCVSSRNKSGYKGVFFYKNRFIAHTRINGKTTHIGSFKTAREAAEAYHNYLTTRHGEFVHPSVRVPELTGAQEA